MWEVFHASIAAVNLPYTIFLGLILLYWLTVILGALDLDLFDVDLETDVEADVDVSPEVDAAADTAVPGLGGVGVAVLSFFHVGTVPLMILLSFFALSLWVISVLTNYYLRNQSLFVALLIFLPNALASLWVTKLVTLPLRALFARLHAEHDDTDEVVGKLCVIKTTRVDATSGQAEVSGTGAPLRLNVRTVGDEVLKKGEEALVVEFNQKNKAYIVTKLLP